MSSSAFLADPNFVLIADASVIINLNASGLARQIIKGIAGRVLVSPNASIELEIGERFGHDDAKQLDALVAADVLGRIQLGPAALATYASLIDDSLGQTLDDGEAATIAVAVERGAVALLEKKARRMCERHFPLLTLGCSAQLLLHAVGIEGGSRAAAMTNALQKGRMRVPLEFVGDVVRLIGDDVAAACHSLPRATRASAKKSE